MNRSALNDVERSFKDFKRDNVPTRFLGEYNSLISAIQRQNLETIQRVLSPSLFKVLNKLGLVVQKGDKE